MSSTSTFFSNALAQPTHLDAPTLLPLLYFIVAYALVNHLVCRPLSAALSATYRALDDYEKEAWVSRCVSQVHAFASCAFAWVALGDYDCFLCPENLFHGYPPLSKMALAHTGGYLLHDLLDLFRNGRRFGKYDGGPLVFLHHIFGVLGYIHVYAYEKMILVYVAWILCEVSTPFLNMIWFGGMLKMPTLRAVSGLMLWVSYVPSRIFASPATAYALWINRGELTKLPPFLQSYLYFILVFATIMNYYWFYKITLGCVKALGKLRKPEKSA